MSGRNHGQSIFLGSAGKCWIGLAASFLAMASPLPAAAQSGPAPDQAASPIGSWETIDDKTGKPTAVVEIFEKDSRLFGRIVAILSGADAKSLCVACTDERKNQPIIGMIIIRSLKTTGPDYSGGDILDPDSGAVYRCKMHLEKNGRELIVRGFIGLSLFGRSQTWHRRT